MMQHLIDEEDRSVVRAQDKQQQHEQRGASYMPLYQFLHQLLLAIYSVRGVDSARTASATACVPHCLARHDAMQPVRARVAASWLSHATI